MNPSQDHPLEDSLVDKLAEWDEALAKGDSSTIDISSIENPELKRRLNKGLLALQSLQKLRSKPPTHTHSHFLLDQESTWIKAAIEGERASINDPIPILGRMGRFQVRRELGRGGFGMVYLAFDPTLHREVALKIPHAPSLLTPILQERFTQEARAAARLNHPNIITIHEAGQSGPIHFIAYAYSPGQTLSQWLKDRQQSVSFHQASHLLLTLASAMAYAHDQKVIHRDLKPANILLEPRSATTTDADQGEVSPLPFVPKITDFGLAKSPGAPDCTRTGTILGTPSYMAPEQALGKGQTSEPAVDIYALGAIFYELLTGLPPFRGESELETLQKVRAEDPIPPRQLRPRTPKDLETICLKCLRKEPQHRYRTAHELAEDIRRYLRHEPILARPVSRLKKWGYWARRHPTATGLTFALIVSLLLGLSGILWQWYRAEEFADQTITERNLAMIDKQKAQQLLLQAHGAIKRLTGLGEELLRNPATEQRGRDILNEALKYYRELLKENTANPDIRTETARTSLEVGRIYHVLGQRKDAEEMFLSSLSIIEEQIANSTSPTFADRFLFGQLQLNLAHFYRDLQAWPKAQTHYRSAIDSFAKLRDEKPSSTLLVILQANSHLNLATVMRGQWLMNDAVEQCQTALTLQDEAIKVDPRNVNHRLEKALCLDYLGTIYVEMNQPEKGLPFHMESYSIRSELLKNTRPNAAGYNRASIDFGRSLFSLGRLYQVMKLEAESFKYYLQTAHHLENLCPKMPSTPDLHGDLGEVYFRLGFLAERQQQFNASEVWYRKAFAKGLENVRRFPKTDYLHQDFMKQYKNLARFLAAHSSVDEANKICQEGRKWVAPLLKQQPPDVNLLREYVDLLHQYCTILEKLNRDQECLAIHKEAIELCRVIWGKTNSIQDQLSLSKALSMSGTYLVRKGQTQAALEAFRQATLLQERSTK